MVGPAAHGRDHRLENLRNGEYKISMELLDKTGSPVAGSWNKANRTIIVNRNAADDDQKAGKPAHGQEHHQVGLAGSSGVRSRDLRSGRAHVH
jgi:hypothetical protein